MLYLKLYLIHIKLTMKSIWSYKFAFVGDFVSNVLWFSVSYALIWMFFYNFKFINGWGYYETMLLYAINLFTSAVAGMFIWNGMNQMEANIRKGTFDSILMRPINPLLHICFRNFGHTFLGPIVLSIPIFYICLTNLNISWSFSKIFLFTFFIICGIIIHISVNILTGALTFWFTKSELIDVILWDPYVGFRRYVDFPLTIYNKGIQYFLLFVIPFGFVNFFPVSIILKKDDLLLFPPIMQYLTPVMSIVFLVLVYGVWKKGLARYNGTGS